MNTAIIMGRLTKDVEVKTTSSNEPVSYANITLAVDYGKDMTDFINVTVWGAQAERLAEYKKKGDQILVQGALRQNVWDDKNGTRHYETYINAVSVEFTGSAPKKSEADAQPTKYNRTGRR